MSILQTIDLKKYYGIEPNITRALDGVNFSVDEGEFVAVVGTSGSGKSTLALLGASKPARKAASISPIEAQKYTGVAGTGFTSLKILHQT